MSGGVGSIVVNPDTPEERKLHPLSDGNFLKYGDVVRIVTGGGGGHGHPFDRPAEAVLEDVLGGFVTPEGAAEHYGVVIRDDAIDVPATEARRAERTPVRAFHRNEYVDALT